MIAQILPSLNLPTNMKIDTFSYIIPQKFESTIKIGQTVEVNFRNKKIQGIIIEITDDVMAQNISPQQDTLKLKPINKIIQSDIQITQIQLDIINFISENYYISKAKALKTVITEMPKNKLKN